MKKDLLVLLLVSLLSLCLAVDRGNFKTCSQSGFCKRQRGTPEHEGPYSVKTDSISFTSNNVSLLLKSNAAKWRPLTLTLSTLLDRTIRIRLDEAEPIASRYEAPRGHVILEDPIPANYQVIEQSNEQLILRESTTTIVIHHHPFQIDFLTNDTPLISLNNRDLLRIEHQRVRKESTPEADPEEPSNPEEENTGGDDDDNNGGGDEKEVGGDDDDGEDAWEETFKGHTDSKPKGPTSVGMDISFVGFEHVYGIPEHADNLALRNTKGTDPYRLYNLDVFEYELYNPMALYGSIPLMYAHNEESSVGVFWMNTAETWIDVASNVADKSMVSKLFEMMKGDQEIPVVDTHWFSESGIIDLFVMMGPNPADIFRQYKTLTGATPLPPLFAIGYHQCRWNYNDQQDVTNVVDGFDDNDISLDVMWLDIEHTDGKRYFTWDNSKFPEPAAMLDKLALKGRKMVTIVDPHIKLDDNFHVYREAKFNDNGLFVKDKEGKDYEGWCWPGTSLWLDYTNQLSRTLWANLFSYDSYKGSTKDLHLWTDMNEPSVFNGPEITMPKDLVHQAGRIEHRDVHNIYGFYVQQATWEGALARDQGNLRPFLLSRSFFAGSQRFGAIWTGDNTGEWGHLKVSIPMLLTISLSGITLCGADVGGFFKNPDAELVTRWYQAAAFQPFFRAHAHLDTKRREPWLFPKENMMAMRQAIRLRYMLLPYWYTLFYKAEQQGGPIMKPLWVDFPKDKHTFALDDQHLVGSAILVKPVVDQGAVGVTVYLPGENELWYELDSYVCYKGSQNLYVPVHLNKIPAFLRGGTVVPLRERVRRSSSLSKHDPYTLIVSMDIYGSGEGELYHDDFHTHNYRHGKYIHRVFNFNNATLLTSRNLNKDGEQIETLAWFEKILVLGFPKNPSQVILSVGDEPSVNLEFNYGVFQKVLMVRKPGVNINKDFQIYFN